ncbi:MAG: NADH-quinone oxidoreductase subunit NuoE [Firmicutes bacterium]|jgi:NADH:ubiquinone oxidoreductase subunit E|nr:NADH-quinone oxidoreductase subunit NuoE [Bacillota bacterium]
MASDVQAKRPKLESVGGECKCHGKLPDDRFTKLHDVIEEYKDKPGSLIPVLHEAQKLFGCLPEDVQQFVAKGLGVPESEVYGVATFYSLFSLKPKGKWTISVCLGTACYVKGAADCLEALKKELGIDIGGTSEDGLFTLEGVRCVGACALAPVVVIGDTVYAKVKPEDIKKILAEHVEAHSAEAHVS